ncbi:MAG TPA: SGNH/GDSL hydrolase family protein [Planctomycetota bacterium]|nr:SGNH/GDSL hydrolase family protein [Planctomycetota bacterium]
MRILFVLSMCSLSATALSGEELAAGFIKKLDAGKKQQMVVYGTSLTAGGAWVNQLREKFNEKYPGLLSIFNGAQSGMNSTWGVQNVESRVIAAKPDVALIEFGINDAVQRFKLSKEDCRKNVNAMIDAIKKALPDCEVILMTMNSVAGENGAKRGGQLPDYYQIYRDIAAERKLLLIDHYVHWKSIQDRNSKRFDGMVPDGVHPTPEACKAVIIPEFERVFFGKK